MYVNVVHLYAVYDSETKTTLSAIYYHYRYEILILIHGKLFTLPFLLLHSLFVGHANLRYDACYAAFIIASKERISLGPVSHCYRICILVKCRACV